MTGGFSKKIFRLEDWANRFGFLYPSSWGRKICISLALKMRPIDLDFLSLEDATDRFGYLEPRRWGGEIWIS